MLCVQVDFSKAANGLSWGKWQGSSPRPCQVAIAPCKQPKEASQTLSIELVVKCPPLSRLVPWLPAYFDPPSTVLLGPRIQARKDRKPCTSPILPHTSAAASSLWEREIWTVLPPACQRRIGAPRTLVQLSRTIQDASSAQFSKAQDRSWGWGRARS